MAVISRASTKPKKIAILGGGISSLTTALYLTGQPGWQERYDVTIYQVGWRLGGKGASGRNKKYGQRVEEYGIHLWYGLYYNAFRMMREVYEELDRPKEIPIRTFEDAFKPLILMNFDLPLQGGEPIKNCFILEDVANKLLEFIPQLIQVIEKLIEFNENTPKLEGVNLEKVINASND